MQTLVLSCTVLKILQVFCSWPHHYSTLILGVFPLDQIAHIGVSLSINLKLISREIFFEVFQALWSQYLNVTDRRTNRQTTCCGIMALCAASHGKKAASNLMLCNLQGADIKSYKKSECINRNIVHWLNHITDVLSQCITFVCLRFHFCDFVSVTWYTTLHILLAVYVSCICWKITIRDKK